MTPIIVDLALSQGLLPNIYHVIVNKQTGFNYLYVAGGGLTVLVDPDGKPIVTYRIPYQSVVKNPLYPV